MTQEHGDDEATKAVNAPRAVLLVGSSEALAARCRGMCLRARVMLIVESDLAALTNTAVERKPLALLFPDDIYAFDSAEFDALARDIQAAVVTLEPGVTDEVIEARLAEALLRAELLRQPEPSSSRYVLVPEGPRRSKRR
ncbi:hypothetical protein WMF27_12710 [Sorangium sp. So ce281]|uniref:hypothetical protein n=1 Tax=unclassified Sorangium TaxID=2621164 RepID=UPI003F5F2939